MRKYNPTLKRMVDNYRKRLSEDGIDSTKLTDEQLYDIIDYWATFETSEEQYVAVKHDVEMHE